jgi:hypothetical protein
MLASISYDADEISYLHSTPSTVAQFWYHAKYDIYSTSYRCYNAISTVCSCVLHSIVASDNTM